MQELGELVNEYHDRVLVGVTRRFTEHKAADKFSRANPRR